MVRMGHLPARGAIARRASVLAVLIALTLAASASAQQILIDRGRRAAGLWCFPLVTDPKEFVYIPSSARLSRDQDGHPQFSFIQYVMNTPGQVADETITAAGGGGVLTFLVLYETPQETVDAAKLVLQRELDDDEVKLRGPIVFSDGRYALVSSIIGSDGGKTEKKLLTTGRAPVLEGNRIALSFDLAPEQASLLMESFAMDTPDVSLVFDMTFTGLNEAYDAELLIDWAEVSKHETLSAGGSIYFVSADVEIGFDEMLRDNAIRLRSSGSDATMEALLDTVYNKLLELMFQKVEPERIPAEERGGLMDAMGALLSRSGAGAGGSTSRFGIYGGYQLKELRSSGTSVLNFDHRGTVERHAFITFNIGDFYQRFGSDERHFRAANLLDAVYQQREIHVSVDGALLPDFGRYVNTVTVSLRKVHQDEKETLREVVIDRESFSEAPGKLRMVYGWSGDEDRLKWLEYEYRTRWSFKGGGTYETEWTPTDAAMIDVFAPYEVRTVQLLGSEDVLEERGVRAAIVQIEYPFFGERRKKQMVARPGKPIEEQQVEITLPRGEYEYEYSITWYLEGGRRLTAAGKDSSGLVFVDELPEE